MDSNTPPLNFELQIEDGVWRIYCDQAGQAPVAPGTDASVSTQRQAGFLWIGTAVGPKALTREEATEVIRRFLSSKAEPGKSMTVADFVEKKFIPVYLSARSASTRINYRSILKHIVDPDLVDRAFGSEAPREGRRIRFIPGWPYLGDLRLDDVGITSVLGLINAAIERGYSMHTVSQIRNAVCMIFWFANIEKDFVGRNPARYIEWPGVRRRPFVHTIDNGTLRNNVTSTRGF